MLCSRDVNQAVDYVFSNGINLVQDPVAASSSAASGSYSQSKAKAVFDRFTTTNDMGEVVMD